MSLTCPVKFAFTVSKVTSASVATLCGIETTPLVIETPVPPLKCALVSVGLGPVYVITPVELLYDKLPSPPLPVTEIELLALVVVW